jgi:hypothetical protein
MLIQRQFRRSMQMQRTRDRNISNRQLIARHPFGFRQLSIENAGEFMELWSLGVGDGFIGGGV